MAEDTVTTTTAEDLTVEAFRGRGNYSRRRSNYQRNDLSNGRTERSPTPMRTFSRTCASNEHTARDCPERQPAYRDENMPFNQQSKN